MKDNGIRTIHNKKPKGPLAYFSNKCPRCHGGAVYRSFFSMNATCPNCGMRYEAEEGFFSGAMFISCVFLPVMVIPTMLVFAYNDRILVGGVFSVVQILLLSPFVTRLSRLFWLHMCCQFDANKAKK